MLVSATRLLIMTSMYIHRAVLVVVGVAAVVCAAGIAAADDAPRPVDLLVVNAALWTNDPKGPKADSFVVADGKFLAVGERAGLAKVYKPREVIDAGGRRVIPGLIDAHVHLVNGGLSRGRLQLREARNLDDFLRKVREEVERRKLGKDDWLLGRGWTTESWPKNTPPLNRGMIDFECGVPIVLYRMDGHAALANSAAVRRAGIDERGPPDPPGGAIERDPVTRYPTGILKDAAIDLVTNLIPQAAVEAQVAAISVASREANRFGVTTVNTMSEWTDLAPLREVHDRGGDTLRVGVYVSEPVWSDYLARVKAFPVRDDRLWIAGFKAYMDGSLGSRTAYMHEPFSDQPGNRGLLSDTMLAAGRMEANLMTADRAGLQAAIHSIGDEANHRLLDLYAEVAAKNGLRDRRPRVEHAQHLLAADIPRFAKLGVVASMQPFHKADDARYAEERIGAERSRTSYAFADLVRSGAHVAFGSDWPVVTMNPLAGIHVAVTGWTMNGNPWMTHENLTVEQALAAYTSGAAYACKMEDRLGRIAPGYLADFVILESDLLTIAPADLANVNVHSTYLAGRRVWPAAAATPGKP